MDSADKPTAELKALELLKIFDGDASAAIKSLQEVAARSAVLKKQSKHVMISTDVPVLVELTKVSKTYKLGHQKVEALRGVSLQIRQGEFVAITGASGSGKSTLLQLIGGLDKPSDGMIQINSQDIGRLSDRKLSKFRNQTIGFVFQFFYLQPFLRLQANLEVPGMFARTKRNVRSAHARELAASVGLGDQLNHLPKQLSGGQMQRAAIARALQNKPKLILADEPTGNLDSTNGSAIIDLFEQVRQTFDATVVVVTHDAKIAARADRTIMIADGVLV